MKSPEPSNILEVTAIPQHLHILWNLIRNIIPFEWLLHFQNPSICSTKSGAFVSNYTLHLILIVSCNFTASELEELLLSAGWRPVLWGPIL